MSVLKDYFEGFYRLLIEVDQHFKEKNKADEQYSTVCTILINIISLENIDFLGEINNDLASPVIKNMKVKER